MSPTSYQAAPPRTKTFLNSLSSLPSHSSTIAMGKPSIKSILPQYRHPTLNIQTVPRADLNPHERGTTPSRWRVYQFHHLGNNSASLLRSRGLISRFGLGFLFYSLSSEDGAESNTGASEESTLISSKLAHRMVYWNSRHRLLLNTLNAYFTARGRSSALSLAIIARPMLDRKKTVARTAVV